MRTPLGNTLGPWETSYLLPSKSADGEWGICEAGGGDMIAHVEQRDDAEAIANLIAAAPKMLALLEKACRLMPLGTKVRAEFITHANAVIKEAKGRA